MKPRIILIFLLFLSLWSLIFVKAIYVQVVPNSRLEALRSRQYQKKVTVKSRRGLIFDREGKELAISVASYSLFADPKIIKNPKTVARKIAKLLNKKRSRIYKKIKNKKRRFVWIDRQLSKAQKQKVDAWKVRGLGFIEEPKRVYPNGKLLSQTLGFTGREGHGLEGIELKYNSDLQGDELSLSFLRDARGRPLLVDGQVYTRSRDGAHVHTTIDSELQYKLEYELSHAIDVHDADSAVGVILDAQTSEVLALANSPGYDLNNALNYADKYRRNRAVSNTFEPGSTMKTFVVAAALREKLFKPNSKIYCEKGKFKIGRRTIRDDHHSYEWLTVSDVLALSSNIGVTKMALKLGDKKLNKALSDFGFGKKLGIDFPGEASGVMSALPWRDHLMSNISFGHGVAVSAVQMAAAYAAIASDGKLRRPYFVRELVDSRGEVIKQFEPKVIREVIDPELAAMLRLMLTTATDRKATGYNARVTGFPVAGKTGTAQMVDPVKGGYLKKSYISSFAGMVPANDPRFVIYVVVNNPRKEYYASQVAAPIFSKVARFALQKSGIHPVIISNHDIIKTNNNDGKAKARSAKLKKQRQVMQQVMVEQGVFPELRGLSLRSALRRVKGLNVAVKVSGSGVVTRSYPPAGESFEGVKRIKLVLKPGAEVRY